MSEKANANPSEAVSVPHKGASDVRTITIEVPRGGFMSGFDAIFKVLFLFAGWMLVGIAYLCVPGSLIAAVLGAFVGVTNLANGVGAMLLGFGCGICCLGLCLPLLFAAGRGRVAALGVTRQMFGSAKAGAAAAAKAPGKIILIMLAVSLLGAALAGAGALMGGPEAIVLPELLDQVFSMQPPAVADPHAVASSVSAA